MIKNVLLVYVPSREGAGEGALPLGLLYVGGILERLGIKVEILDLYVNKKSYDDKCGYLTIKESISKLKPDMVGFGGVATSYSWTKELSKRLKEDYPHIIQLAGGSLASTYELLLTKTAIDIVFHGEVELSLPQLIEKLNHGTDYRDVPGISYVRSEKIERNQVAPQIRNLDQVPFPSYHLVDTTKYFVTKKSLIDAYGKDMQFQGLYDKVTDRIKYTENFFPILTSRGCTHRCSFCYRHFEGHRQHSVEYVIKHIKFVMEKFNINGFDFMDELFNASIEWVMEWCDALKKNDIKIAYRIACRADNVSEEMLDRLFESGCYCVNYGQESGSDKILKEYRKGVTRQTNIDVTLMTRSHGIYSIVLLVIGSPGETHETIMETIDFLKKVRVNYYSVNYLMPLPGAPIWKHAMDNNLIKDVEVYLSVAAKLNAVPIINLTKVPDRDWRKWGSLIRYELDIHYWRNNGNFIGYFKCVIMHRIKTMLSPIVKIMLKKQFKNVSG